jgi:molybdopterin-guanine dinucleotide biosynthesis protein
MKRPFIIGIGGSCSNAGKTTIACSLLRYFKKDGLQKWGAIKYTKTELYASLVDDRAALSQKDKDTGRFIAAGSDEVLWVKSPPQDLNELLPMAMDRMSRVDGLIVEGNSVIEFLNPDIVIFIFRNKKTLWKDGIERLVGISDIIIYENESELPEIAKAKRLFRGDMSAEKEIQDFFLFIADLMHERNAERRNNKKGC